MPHERSLYPEHTSEDVTIPLSIALESGLLLVNLLPICVVLKFKKSKERQATDELIVALCVTDILSVIIPSPIGIVSSFHHHWYGGALSCNFYQLCVVCFQLASMCLVTFMCIDRWLSLSGTMAYRKPSTSHKRTRITIGIIYACVLLVSCLPLFGFAPNAYVSETSCQSWLIRQPQNPIEHVFFIAFLVIGYANLVTAIIVNCTVIVTLWKFQRKFGIKPSERINSCAVQIDRKTVVEFSIMVLIVTAVFYLAWLPALMMITVQHIGIEVGQVVVVYSLLSTTLTGLLNPVIYGTFSKAYRLGYTRIIVAISKFMFGCPLSQEDVLSDISSQARRLRSTPTGNSSAALIHANAAGESRSGYSGVNVVTPPGDCDQNYQAEEDGAITSSVAENSRRDTLDMHERTYFGELLSEQDTYGDLDKDKYGSNLSLISEDSSIPEEDCSTDLTNPNRHSCTYQSQVIVQESMI